LNNLPENQLTKSHAVYTVKANRGPKFVVMHDSRVTMITKRRTELTSFYCYSTLLY